MESVFYFSDGRTVNSVPDLAAALASLDNEVFRHHCNSEKNDFYEWINHGLGQKKTAVQIKNLKTAKGMARKLNKIMSQEQ